MAQNTKMTTMMKQNTKTSVYATKDLADKDKMSWHRGGLMNDEEFDAWTYAL